MSFRLSERHIAWGITFILCCAMPFLTRVNNGGLLPLFILFCALCAAFTKPENDPRSGRNILTSMTFAFTFLNSLYFLIPSIWNNRTGVPHLFWKVMFFTTCIVSILVLCGYLRGLKRRKLLFEDILDIGFPLLLCGWIYIGNIYMSTGCESRAAELSFIFSSGVKVFIFALIILKYLHALLRRKEFSAFLIFYLSPLVFLSLTGFGAEFRWTELLTVMLGVFSLSVGLGSFSKPGRETACCLEIIALLLVLCLIPFFNSGSWNVYTCVLKEIQPGMTVQKVDDALVIALIFLFPVIWAIRGMDFTFDHFRREILPFTAAATVVGLNASVELSNDESVFFARWTASFFSVILLLDIFALWRRLHARRTEPPHPIDRT